jgi:hypothetical protein
VVADGDGGAADDVVARPMVTPNIEQATATAAIHRLRLLNKRRRSPSRSGSEGMVDGADRSGDVDELEGGATAVLS